MTTRKLLFLDIDGVLNLPGRDPEEIEIFNPWRGVSPKLVARLNAITLATGAVIVVSSSWRLFVHEARWGISFDEFVAALRDRGGITAPIVGITPRLCKDYRVSGCTWLPRSQEILAYLASVKDVESYVILDDDTGAAITGHFVEVDAGVGLTDENVAQAITILGGCLGQ